MRAYDIIKKKRDGSELTRGEISSFLTAYCDGSIPDYQASAFLMAAFLRGLSREETRCLTEVMINSGQRLDLTDIPGPKVDKHSTGGVGDKVSLVLAPLAAAAGVIVPMMSGRGLGHTGGTLDKLESIPGFRTSLAVDEIRAALSRVGCAMTGVTEQVTPLDRKLYALRDVTATIESVPLITASIMSKKLSEGIDGLVLDVKTGAGAFMKDLDRARELAAAMVETGNAFGVRTAAVITDMDEPLGLAVGNSLEVIEALHALKGDGPEDLMEVTLFLGAVMLRLSGMEHDLGAGKETLKGYLADGSALRKFEEIVMNQGGRLNSLTEPPGLPSSCVSHAVVSRESGYLQATNAEDIGRVSMVLGAGRETMEDSIDYEAGILLRKKRGDAVRTGDVLCVLHTRRPDVIREAEELCRAAFRLGGSPPEKRSRIIEVAEA
ncbi:MAG: thymidine phosphorylase [Nitrospiraceae bacterium]|nr:MAG: thymidine phosphorylase [Nitrospiraceae bacterium]